MTMVSSRVLALAGSVLFVLPLWSAESPPPRPGGPLASLRQLDEGFVYLFEKVAPSVVVIDASRAKSGGGENEGFDFFRLPDDDSKHPFRMPEPSNRSEGSGFIIRPDGYLLTNHHVIEGAEKISVRLKDGRRFPAKVVGVDDRTDIAVLKIEAKDLPAVEFGDSEALRIGQLVGAIGVPFELDYSFTVGCVSGKGRSGFSRLTYEDYIQTDAFINPGNSGGPLFDVEGRVVGMNTLINGIGRGLAFAIPSNQLQDVANQLITSGRVRRPALGIRIETLREESALRDQVQGIDKGVIINTIEPDTPAYRSDLRPADVITAIDGVPVATSRDLQKQVLAKKVGQKVTLSIWRAGKAREVAVTTGELPGGETVPASNDASTPPGPREAASPEKTYGIELEDAGPDKPGARISKVEPGSPAAIAELQPGDVITEIDSKPIENAGAARNLLAGRDSRKAALLFVQRKGQKTYAVLKIEK